MKFGKVIKLFLMDGTPNGRWMCELSNWTGIAYKIPRNMVKESENREELSAPGVYFLFGRDDEKDKPLVYIGEAENIIKRLKQHLDKKDNWNEVIAFISKDSNLNNVKFNLYVLPESNYPDIKGGNLIIAGHSGNYNNSYFANLYMLEVNDDIVIHYNNKKYVYKIDKIYNEKKTGRVRILRNKNNTTLTLITCTKDDNYHQTVYIAYLTSVE